jgi:hypothetical protein
MKIATYKQVKIPHDSPLDDLTKSDVEDVKLDNVFANYKEGDTRFSDVKLGNLGGTHHKDSNFAKESTPVGAPMWNSPEITMETP